MKTEISDQTLWGLEEQSRFPLKAAGWDLIDSNIVITRPKRLNQCQPYAIRAFVDADAQILAGVKRLLEERPEDFKIAASGIKPEAWRLLFYRGFYTAEAVTLFRFRAEVALRQLCTMGDDGGNPPLAWLGTDRDIEAISSELDMALREMGEAPATAAWLVLCLAQRADLTRSESLQCTFWDPPWVRAFTEKVQIVP